MKLNNLFTSVSIALAAGLPIDEVMANPTGAQIVNGQVTFSQPNQNTLQVNNSHGAIINWQDFSINAGELTHFQQSGANSAVLNQVVGNNISNIFGSLTSNGQVYLINPAGIVFGQNSIINTSGFIASTLNLSNQDFLQGKLNFTGVDAGDILNQGYITAGAYGDIALIAPNITNEGVIEVQRGDVILAAGEKVTLASLDASAVGFEVQSAENTVTNLGSVITDGGAVGMFAGSLKHSGVVSANALSLDENGNVILVAKNNLTISDNSVTSANGDNGGRIVIQNENGTTWVSGTVEANGVEGVGGVVDVLGQQVGVIDSASISADGKHGGGEIHIGGNYQGKGELQNATGTYVGQNTSLSANAIESGNGGEIIVWADEATRAYGSISAAGGEQFGDGGFVETSGKAYLDVNGIDLNLNAVNGNSGSWLLDPHDVTIIATGGTLDLQDPDFSALADGSTVGADIIVASLNSGINVTINTGVTSNLDLGNINVNAPISMTGLSPSTLTLEAENHININSPITSTNGPLSLNFTADSDYNLGADGVGSIFINTNITTNGGTVSLISNGGSGGVYFGHTAGLGLEADSVTINTDWMEGNGNGVTIKDIQANTLSITSAGAIWGFNATQLELAVASLDINHSVAQSTFINNETGIDLALRVNDTLGTSSVDITHDADIQLDVITMGAGGTLSLSAPNGSIIDANGAAVNIDAFFTTLNALNGIGTADALETQNLVNLFADNTGAIIGAIELDNLTAGSVNIDLTNTAAGGEIIFTNLLGATAVPVGGGQDVTTNNGNITLVSNDINVQGPVNSGAGILTISSGFGLDMDLGSFVGAGFVLDSTEFGNLTYGSLVIGQAGIGGVFINNPLTIASDLTIEGANISFSQPVSTIGITATGNVTLNAQGSIFDNAIAEMDVVAQNITFNALAGIGITDPLEIQLSGVTGIFSFNNVSGNVDVINTAISPTDIMQLVGDNLGIGDIVTIGNDFGVTEVFSTGVTSNGGLLEIVTDTLNVNAILDNNNSALPIKLLVNEVDIAANINSTTGGLLIGTLTDGTGITFAGGVTPDLDLVQTDIDFINAPFVDFGVIDVPVPGQGTGDITFAGAIDFGARNVSFSTMGDVRFIQGAVTAITTTGNVFLDTIGSVVGQPTFIPDIIANQLDFISDFDFGSTVGDAIEIDVTLFAGDTTGGYIYVDSASSLTAGIITSTSGLPIRLEAAGDITLATINSSGSDIILDTTVLNNGVGGAILDDTVVANNINGANQLQLFSETGVGTLTNPIEISNVAANIIADSVMPGNIYIDNVGTLSGSLLLDSLTTSAGEIFVRNLNSLQTTDVGTLIDASGNVTIESNSDINVNNNVVATGGGTIDLRVVGGAGNINVNAAVQTTTGAINLDTVNGDILFGAGGNLSSLFVNLSASGLIDDGVSTNAIGAGVEVSQLSALAGTGILLDGANNNAAQILLISTSGDIVYTDVDSFLLDGAYATSSGLATGVQSGDVTLTSANQILDFNGGGINIAAINAVVNAVNGIGVGDQIETHIDTSLSFNNSADGVVDFHDLEFNPIEFWGSNNSINSSTSDFTRLISQNDSITVPIGQALTAPNADLILDTASPGSSITIGGAVSVSNAANKINLLTPFLNISATGSVTATGTASLLSVLMKVDDLDIVSGGTVNAGVGDLAIENLTDTNTISIGGALGDLNLSATDLAALSGGRLGIGMNGGSGAGSITIDGAVTFAIDTKLASVGDITFNQGAANGITSTANVELNTEGAIIDLSAGGYDVAANGLNLIANNGIGNLNALDTQVAAALISNLLSGAVNIENNTANISVASINQNAAGAALSLTNTSNIDFINNAASPNITSAGGNVSLISGGSILDAGAVDTHIFGANSVTLNSSTGIGTIVTPITVEDIGAGGLSVFASGANNIYVDHVIGSLNSDFIISAINAVTGQVIINNLNAAQDTRITGPVSISGGTLSIVSPSSMFVDGDITDNGAGTIGLQVTGVGGNLFINTGIISSNGGTISLTADTDITLNGTGDIFNAGGLTSLFATNGVLSTLTAAGVTGNGDLNASALNGIDLQGNNDVNLLNLSTTNNNIDYFDVNDVQLDLISASTGGVSIGSAGHILDGNTALNNITSSTATLNSTDGIGTLADPLEASVSNFLQFANSTSNGVYIVNSVPGNVLLNGTNSSGDIDITLDGNILLQALNASGDIVLSSVNGGIQDVNGVGVVNLSANNITLSSFGHIGGGDPVNTPAPIDTQLAGATGTINVANANTALGHIEIENQALSVTDVVTFTASNAAANAETVLLNPFGVLEIGNVTTQGFIEFKALELNLNGVVNNNDALGATSILLVADEFDVTTGSINANAGNLDIATFADGRAITLGANVGGTFDLVQSDVDALSAALISIGVMDTITPYGSGDVTVAGSLDFGAADLKLQTLGNIILNNGVSNGIATSTFMVLATAQGITSDASTGVSLIAPSMSISATTGIGAVNAVRTQTSNLTILNSNSGNLNVTNTGSLSLSDSANLAGAMSITSDNILTLTPNLGLGGTTGAVASTDLKLEGANGLLINGVVSGGNVSLLSPNGIGINDIITASGNLLIDSDTDSNGVGDLLIENTLGGVLDVTAANMSLHSASTILLATSGAVHVHSNGGMNLVAANDLNILGGDALGADAYLSARGNMNFDIGGNILMSSGTAANTAVSIFDATGVNNNNLNLTAGGNVTMLAGNADNSGAFITVANLDMNVTGTVTLTGGAGNSSPAIIDSKSGVMRVVSGGTLSLIPGAGTASPALIVSNNGFGYLDISYPDCIGCDTGLKFLDQPITNTANGEIVNTTNFTTDPIISSQDQLALANEELLFEPTGERSPRPDGELQSDPNEPAPEEETDAASEPEPEIKVLVCR